MEHYSIWLDSGSAMTYVPSLNFAVLQKEPQLQDIMQVSLLRLRAKLLEIWHQDCIVYFNWMQMSLYEVTFNIDDSLTCSITA